MGSWSEFETSAPDFGAAARRLFIGADGVAFKTTDPIFRLSVERALWVYWERAGQPDTKAVRRRWPPDRGVAQSGTAR